MNTDGVNFERSKVQQFSDWIVENKPDWRTAMQFWNTLSPSWEESRTIKAATCMIQVFQNWKDQHLYAGMTFEQVCMAQPDLLAYYCRALEPVVLQTPKETEAT